MSSVLEQQGNGIEVVVVDDGSSDDTASVVSRIRDDRLAYHFQHNQGRCVARNTGVEAAKGEFVVFLDDDDEACEDSIATFAAMAGTPGVDLICCADDHFGAAGQLTRTDHPSNLGPIYENLKLNYQPGAFAIRRSRFLQLGGYLPALELCENTELFIRLARMATAEGWSITCSDKPVVRINEFGQTLSNNPARLAKAIDKILEAHSLVFAKHPAKLAQFCEIAGVNSAKSGELSKARHFFWRAIKARPSSARNYFRLLCCSAILAKLIWARDHSAS